MWVWCVCVCVCVCDEQSSKRAFGIEGQVVQHSTKDGMVLIRVTDFATQLSTMAEYAELRSEFVPLPKEKSLRKLTNDLRMIWLEDLGSGSMSSLEFPRCVDELAGFKPVRLRAEHIRLWFKYLLWKFDLDLERVMTVGPTLVHAWMSTRWVQSDEWSVGHKQVRVKQERVLERTGMCV